MNYRERLLFLIILTLSTFAVSGCELDNSSEPTIKYYLKSDGAILPIWVTGNKEAETVIIFLHGGPGRSSIPYMEQSPGHSFLREKYRVVYFDQRFSGASWGNPDPSTLTLDNMVLDTVRVINLIKQELSPDKIILMGKSWGGAIGTALCANEEYANLVNGWIEVDGAHNLKDGISYAIDWVKNKATNYIADGTDVSYWRKAIEYYNTEPVIDADFMVTHGSYINTANGIYLDPADDPGAGTTLSSPISPLSILNALYVAKNMDFYTLNLTDEMKDIVVPTAIIWGEHDGTLPVQLAYEAFDALTCTKELHVFNNSAHSVSFAEPEDFFTVVEDFIENISE